MRPGLDRESWGFVSRHPSGSRLAAVASAILITLPQIGCHGTQIDSPWRSRPISIDGQRDEWPGQSVYGFERENIRFGVENDSTSLYLMVSTTDRRLALQALGKGVQVRLQPDGGGNVLWIGSPHSLALARSARPRRSEREENTAAYPGAPPPVVPDDMTERIRAAIGILPEEIEVFAASGEDSLVLSFAEAARRGIQVEVGCEDDGRFVVEMKVPLRKTAERPHAIGLQSAPGGRAIELKLKIPRPKEEAPAYRGDRREGASLRLDRRFTSLPSLAQTAFQPRHQGDLFPDNRWGSRRSLPPEGLDVTIRIRLSAEPSPKP
jgi:hypothetical protein